jgi:hypothetical protein
MGSPLSTAAAALEALSHNYTVMPTSHPDDRSSVGQARASSCRSRSTAALVSQQLTQQLKWPVIGEALDYKIDQARLEIRAMADAPMRS